MRFIAAIALVILLAALARPQNSGQSKGDKSSTGDDTLRLKTELVNVFFSAYDRNNRVVSDIRPEEVSVLEDGRPQPIFTFKHEADLPINIALLIDLSGSQEYTFPQEKAAASRFLRSLIRPGKDSASILTFREEVELVQGPTSNIDTLDRSLEEIEFSRRFGASAARWSATALYDAIYIAVDEVLGPLPVASGEDQTARRAIILMTDGVDNASSRKLDEAIDRAWRSGVIVYAIGIGDRFRFEGVRDSVLIRIAEETGGRAYFPQGPEDLLSSIRQIENELRSQYLVAYDPSSSARDGRFHRIEVRINSRPDVRVVHRRGYYAPKEEEKK
jgi:Ca-activated chloride channel family protein